MSAQDPSEPFDLCDDEGRALGRTKPRGEVHRDGDWHRSVHVWVLLEGDLVVFQKRSAKKDTWPEKLDVAVTGHVRAGEDDVRSLRESEEEIGLALGPHDAVRLGFRTRRDAPGPGLLDNEHQSIFLAVVDRELGDLRASPDELAAILALPLDGACAIFDGEAREATVVEAGTTTSKLVRAGDFVPSSDDYYRKALASIRARRDGKSPALFRIAP